MQTTRPKQGHLFVGSDQLASTTTNVGSASAAGRSPAARDGPPLHTCAPAPRLCATRDSFADPTTPAALDRAGRGDRTCARCHSRSTDAPDWRRAQHPDKSHPVRSSRSQHRPSATTYALATAAGRLDSCTGPTHRIQRRQVDQIGGWSISSKIGCAPLDNRSIECFGSLAATQRSGQMGPRACGAVALAGRDRGRPLVDPNLAPIGLLVAC
jgi:hypothetical protein